MKEIAKLTGTSYSAVNTWLARGKATLRADRARRAFSGGHDSPVR
jgi:DNA-directed RNA polymerase specialized sigma24 family protein